MRASLCQRECSLASLAQYRLAIAYSTDDADDLCARISPYSGNLTLLPGVFPDYMAPIVRMAAADPAAGKRELVQAR